MATVVEGDPKAPFSIATTPRCRRGRYSISLDCSTLAFTTTLALGESHFYLTHTHTHTHIYIYMYIYKEKEKHFFGVIMNLYLIYDDHNLIIKWKKYFSVLILLLREIWFEKKIFFNQNHFLIKINLYICFIIFFLIRKIFYGGDIISIIIQYNVCKFF